MAQIRSAGFTLVEILVVMSIMVIILAIAMTGFRNFAIFQLYEQDVVTVKSALVDSRVQARSAVDEQVHGVKLLNTSIVLFTGNTYSALDPNNETIDLEVTTLTMDLTGGVDEIRFSQLTGIPSATGTINVVGVDLEATTTLEVTAAGVIQ